MEFHFLCDTRSTSLTCYCSGDFASVCTVYYHCYSPLIYYRLSDLLLSLCQMCFFLIFTYCCHLKGGWEKMNLHLLTPDLSLISEWKLFIQVSKQAGGPVISACIITYHNDAENFDVQYMRQGSLCHNIF